MGKVYLGSDVGSDVGSSGGYSGSVFARALARPALEPFRFRKYLFLSRFPFVAMMPVVELRSTFLPTSTMFTKP